MNDSTAFSVSVSASTGIKCPRCWQYHTVRVNYDGLCDRCLRLIVERFPNDYPEAVENWEMQKAKW